MAAPIPRLILDLATVLCVAAVTTLIFRRMKQPAVLGYMLAGLIVGPHVPVPLAADHENIKTLAELGVVLLLFAIGLEFDFPRLLRKGVQTVVMGGMQLGATTLLGFLAGRALGWTTPQSAFMGAALAISSTMIIAKTFEEYGSVGEVRHRVFSVLVVQDLFAILLLAGLGAAGSFGTRSLLLAAGRVVLFLAALLGFGELVVPRLLRWAADRGKDETLLVATMGVCFTCSVLALMAGCSVALGAFVAGVLAAGSGRVQHIERLVLPLRDLFAAIFFVAVGMMLDPASLLAHAGDILAFTAVVLVGDTLGVALGAAAAGLPLRSGTRAGLILATPGEFSFVLVGIGTAPAFLRPQSLSIVVGVCLLSALAGPWLFRHSEAIAGALDRCLPNRVHTLLDRYRCWAEQVAVRMKS